MWFFKTKKSAQKRDTVSIRMEAIGGQGANSAGKILAEAAVLGLGYTGNHFSSFGSEKRGSPIKSYVRFSPVGLPIRTASSIQNPDILMVFHESLLNSHQEILEGVNDKTDLIINTAQSPEKIQFPDGVRLRSVTVVNATRIAMEQKCGLNAAMLGAVAGVCPEIDLSSLAKALESYFLHLESKIRINNMNGFELASKQAKSKDFQVKQASLEVMHSPLPEMGWLNAPLGGVIVNPGNSILKDHSASRKGVAPHFNKELCFNCGYCDMVCPDFCFVWNLDPQGVAAPELKGIDYQYCKGCQKCVVVCPVEALTPVPESQLTALDQKQKVFPDLSSQNIEDRWKKLDWAKYVEELSQEGQMMSLQTELLNKASYLRPDFSDEIIQKTKQKKDSES